MHRERYKNLNYLNMDKQKSIHALQAYATGLAAQSLQHKIESKVFAAQGFSNFLSGLFNTHPNTEERIRILEQF